MKSLRGIPAGSNAEMEGEIRGDFNLPEEENTRNGKKKFPVRQNVEVNEKKKKMDIFFHMDDINVIGIADRDRRCEGRGGEGRHQRQYP